ncbi:DNA methyltransferase [Mordavella massiliensis]|uniref:Methyltransferase n=1 Tax=Mordavella massiliensis TaxID=1871024 RepID=A0A938XEX0_9CLOT|nr:DNA methyltransferase [Mordavella massiliensis]MBM6949528.1 transposase [Mordavella massiliensis]
MSQKSKLSLQGKVKIIRKYMNGAVSLNSAAAEAGVSYETLRQWVMQYQAEGAVAFLPGRKNHTYSPELKLQAVQDYFPNSESNSKYLRYCKKCKIKGHPARFPMALPEFFIKFLTDEGDLVVDIFGGSNTTGMTAENLRRRWKTFEISQDYVAASVFRFVDSEEKAKECYESILAGNNVTL